MFIRWSEAITASEDYFVEAFGGIKPYIDQDATVKFVLNAFLTDDRLGELGIVLTDGHEFGEMGLIRDGSWSVATAGQRVNTPDTRTGDRVRRSAHSGSGRVRTRTS
jgi:hypothetical protein